AIGRTYSGASQVDTYPILPEGQQRGGDQGSNDRIAPGYFHVRHVAEKHRQQQCHENKGYGVVGDGPDDVRAGKKTFQVRLEGTYGGAEDERHQQQECQPEYDRERQQARAEEPEYGVGGL